METTTSPVIWIQCTTMTDGHWTTVKAYKKQKLGGNSGISVPSTPHFGRLVSPGINVYAWDQNLGLETSQGVIFKVLLSVSELNVKHGEAMSVKLKPGSIW